MKKFFLLLRNMLAADCNLLQQVYLVLVELSTMSAQKRKEKQFTNFLEIVLTIHPHRRVKNFPKKYLRW